MALGGFAVLLMAVFTMLGARKRHKAVMQPATASCASYSRPLESVA